MSQVGTSTPTLNLSEGLPITSLTLLVILLIPCVVLLLLLNCLFLGYKLLLFSKIKKTPRTDSENTLLQSTLSTRQRITRMSEAPTLSNKDGKITYVSVSEPLLAQPLSSSRTSERASVDQRIRFIRPDGARGGVSENLRAPSTILATTADSTSRVHLPSRSRLYCRNIPDWRKSAPVLLQSSDSEAERPNIVPPNTPVINDPQSRITADSRPLRRSSTMELKNILNNTGEHQLDMLQFECEYASSIALETSCFVASVNSSNVGPGLDSDFGASAGVSLRILSADSDSLANGMWSSGMEWDCYDPCYVREKNIPKQKHYIPALHTKHYWV
ncbi:hypothetical protein UPYG_G00278260 [Umbra pygmaea]|uniref:Protein huluwa-like n=1 Tax=Umbra pygmaea TaxID=75934 RepID=A0ABD0W2N3_UMBPY